MELPTRADGDKFLPDGALTNLMESLSKMTDAHDLRIGIVYAFDHRTRMLPYWYADKRMAPCSVRTIADLLSASGFKHIRIVLQQWTPNLKPSLAKLDGKSLDVLMVSAMQVHAEPSYDLVRDAFSMGEQRPLILAGGAKAIYEPTDYLEMGPGKGISADCVVTGEGFVLLDLLHNVLSNYTSDSTALEAFRKTRRSGALETVPGLVYQEEGHPDEEPVAINTGIQRLLQNLDEMPMPDMGYRVLEPPHKKKTMRTEPLKGKWIWYRTPIASLITTHGCKFNCGFCPIPAVNQRTWRYKSPKRMAAEIKHIYENFGITNFFGTDDNFFNNRDTVIELMTELAETKSNGRPIGEQIDFFTEATEFDVHRNLDILPLCNKGGLRAIWFGLEDLTADLINKGQTVGKTEALFAKLHEIGIQPMAMMIHSDTQPLRSKDGDYSGLLNQAKYLFDHGAVSYQCTYLGPAVGTRSFEEAVEEGSIFRDVGGAKVPEAMLDGNHVVASMHEKPWSRQMNVLRAYMSFYNPINTLRALWGFRFDSVTGKRLLFQIVGQLGLVLTIPKMIAWSRTLKRGPITKWTGFPDARIAMINAGTRDKTEWAVNHPLPDGHHLFDIPDTPLFNSGNGTGATVGNALSNKDKETVAAD